MAHVTSGPPIAGAYICIPSIADDLGAGASEGKVYKLPPGMKAVLIAVTVDAAVSVSATVEVGNEASINAYCLSQAIPTTAGDLLLNGASINAASGRALIPAGGNLRVTVTTAGGGSLIDAVVTLWLYVVSHANNTPGRVSTRDVLRNPLLGF